MHPDSRCISYWTWGIFHCYGYDVSLPECVIPRDFRRKTKNKCPKMAKPRYHVLPPPRPSTVKQMVLIFISFILLRSCFINAWAWGKNKYLGRFVGDGWVLRCHLLFVVLRLSLCMSKSVYNMYSILLLFFQNEIIASPLLESLWGFRTIKQAPKLPGELLEWHGTSATTE